MSRVYFLVFLVLIYFGLDYYVFQIIRSLVEDAQPITRKAVLIGYWAFTAFALGGVLMYNQLDPTEFKQLRVFITSAFFITFVSKLATAIVMLGDDVRRGVTYLLSWFGEGEQHAPDRADFMKKAALVVGAIPLSAFTFGIISGAHDYRVRRRTISFPNLPKAFDGIRIGQLSDIHTGSFFNKTAVQGGVDMLNAEKPDLVTFTGDLVNNLSDEAKPYLDIFNKIKAPLGVHSTMGNHDYADYSGLSQEAKQKDVKRLHEMHGYMGWNLMLNENKRIQVDGEQIGLLGMENWGAGRFSKYGDMTKTYAGTEELPFKILMSHDPSHWDAQVRPQFPDVDLMLAGHTHGMQFGIEIGDWRWSPSKFIYKQWADLYNEGSQYLYVNRGFGYLGFPGRVGILPEITILELKRS
ncbi:MAG: metallophosphoesterase [Cyclobacteriaceae bacterium]